MDKEKAMASQFSCQLPLPGRLKELPVEILFEVIEYLMPTKKDVTNMRLIHPSINKIIMEGKIISKKLFSTITLAFGSLDNSEKEKAKLTRLHNDLREHKLSKPFLSLPQTLQICALGQGDELCNLLGSGLLSASGGMNNLKGLCMNVFLHYMTAAGAAKLLGDVCKLSSSMTIKIRLLGFHLRSHLSVLSVLSNISNLCINCFREIGPHASWEGFHQEMALMLERSAGTIKLLSLPNLPVPNPYQVSKIIEQVNLKSLDNLAVLLIGSDEGAWSVDALSKLPNLKVLSYHSYDPPEQQSIWSALKQLQMPLVYVNLHGVTGSFTDYLSSGFMSGRLTNLELHLKAPCRDPNLVEQFWMQVLPNVDKSLINLTIYAAFSSPVWQADGLHELPGWCIPNPHHHPRKKNIPYDFENLQNLTFMSIFSHNGSLVDVVSIIGDCPRLKSVVVSMIHLASTELVVSSEQYRGFITSIANTRLRYWVCPDKAMMRIMHFCSRGYIHPYRSEYRWARERGSWEEYKKVGYI